MRTLCQLLPCLLPPLPRTGAGHGSWLERYSDLAHSVETRREYAERDRRWLDDVPELKPRNSSRSVDASEDEVESQRRRMIKRLKSAPASDEAEEEEEEPEEEEPEGVVEEDDEELAADYGQAHGLSDDDEGGGDDDEGY